MVQFVETLVPPNTTAGTALGVAAATLQIALYADDLTIFVRGPRQLQTLFGAVDLS